MRTFQHRVLGILAASLLIAASTMGQMAGGQTDERAGYQGIPVHNGLYRGVIQHEDSSAVVRYPRLPRRPNEIDIAEQESDQAENQQDRAGYAGIPRRNSSRTEMQLNENADSETFERAGYAGIPQPLKANQKPTPGNAFAGRRSTRLIMPK